MVLTAIHAHEKCVLILVAYSVSIRLGAGYFLESVADGEHEVDRVHVEQISVAQFLLACLELATILRLQLLLIFLVDA